MKRFNRGTVYWAVEDDCDPRTIRIYPPATMSYQTYSHTDRYDAWRITPETAAKLAPADPCKFMEAACD